MILGFRAPKMLEKLARHIDRDSTLKTFILVIFYDGKPLSGHIKTDILAR
jgi:hypothetical protein